MVFPFLYCTYCLSPTCPGDRLGIQDKAGKVDDRYKYDDEAGDSDTGADPEDSDFEDEEVDEDEAFNSADEDR